MNIIQRIFTDHYESVKSTGITIRGSVTENVWKMIRCGNMKHGYILYSCEQCGKLKYVPFRCKSRFCIIGEYFVIKFLDNLRKKDKRRISLILRGESLIL